MFADGAMRGKLFLLVTDASFPLGYWQKKAHGTRFQKNKKVWALNETFQPTNSRPLG
jgi:hypothetical protein